MTQWLQIGLTVGFVLLAAVFALIDAAFATMSKGRAKHLAEEGTVGAARVVQILADPAPTRATAEFLVHHVRGAGRRDDRQLGVHRVRPR